MGEQLCRELALPFEISHQPGHPTTADDTRAAVASLVEQDVDLLLFAGGDGTARDICAVAPEGLCVLGIPAGVKIHSGVYGVTPAGTGRLLAKLVRGEPVSLVEADVMDIDETAFVKVRCAPVVTVKCSFLASSAMCRRSRWPARSRRSWCLPTLPTR
ncbi:NAD(+)/NADH kinase [Oceanimonas sp. NS1]|nr:NAD(+)/NADH kinase [Oceanimonas sp. NS1]